jgi:hypothetical protein
MTFKFKNYVLSGRFSEVANRAVARAVAEAESHGLKIPVAPTPQQPPLDQDPLNLVK